MDENFERLAKRLDAARVAQGLSRRAVAKRANVAVGTVNGFLGGKRKAQDT